MRLIDADRLIDDILESPRIKTETVPKLIALINNQPTEARKGVEPTAEPNCADGCIYGWGSDECEKCRFKCAPKHGRWVVVEETLNDCDGHRTFYWYECDNCGARPPKNLWGHEWHSNFCPNCGAKMEADE